MRLFIGLPLSESAREDTAALSVRAQAFIPGRYSLKSNYHMTLAFMGNVSEDQLSAAKEALDAFAVRFAAPRLRLCALSCFGRASNAILIRTVQSTDDLFSMRAVLLDALRSRSLPFTDGPYAPHVTLARHAKADHTPPESIVSAPFPFIAPQAVLYLSARDEQDILRYTPLHCAAFTGVPSAEKE